jgi:hypothetical protein
MRNLLALFAAALLVFVVTGWYLGWYSVQSTPAEEGHNAVHIDIDRHKIGDDLHKGSEKLQETIDKGRTDQIGKSSDASAIDPIRPASNDQ